MGIKDNKIIKGLSSQLSDLEGELESMSIEISNKQKEYEFKKKTINKLKDKIRNLGKSDKISISEHALLRYFERVLDYNIDQIKSEILTDDVIKFVDELGGSGTYPSGKKDSKGEFYRVTLKNNVVVTVGT